VAVKPALGFAGLLEAASLNVEKPAVIDAAQPAILDAPVTEIGAAMRALQAEQTKAALVVAEQHQILAHDPYMKRRAARHDIARQGDRLPVAAHEVAARRTRPGLRQQFHRMYGIFGHCSLILPD